MADELLYEGRPDPAIHDPNRPGLRPHRHPPNKLHAWVFLQDEVWVDYWGNEQEISLMEPAYAEAVIDFCLARAIWIRGLVQAAVAEKLAALEKLATDQNERTSGKPTAS